MRIVEIMTVAEKKTRASVRQGIKIITSGNTDNRGVRVDLSLGAKITLCFHGKLLKIQIYPKFLIYCSCIWNYLFPMSNLISNTLLILVFLLPLTAKICMHYCSPLFIVVV